jgi:hypothetical protein
MSISLVDIETGNLHFHTVLFDNYTLLITLVLLARYLTNFFGLDIIAYY